MTPESVSFTVSFGDGTPDGLRTVENPVWAGRALACARTQLATTSKLEEFDQPGIYVLYADPGSVGAKPQIYVGQAQNLRKRLTSHDAKNPWDWERLAIFVSAHSAGLNPTFRDYLEARLIAIAQSNPAVKPINVNSPSKPTLSDAERTSAEAFLKNMLLVYPLLQIDVFHVVNEAGEESPKLSDQATTLHLVGPDTDAAGAEVPGAGFMVFAGSKAREDHLSALKLNLVQLREELKAEGVLVPLDGALKLSKNYLFKSPSTAAEVLLGTAANGRIKWKDASGKTLKELQESQLP